MAQEEVAVGLRLVQGPGPSSFATFAEVVGVEASRKLDELLFVLLSQGVHLPLDYIVQWFDGIFIFAVILPIYLPSLYDLLRLRVDQFLLNILLYLSHINHKLTRNQM